MKVLGKQAEKRSKYIMNLLKLENIDLAGTYITEKGVMYLRIRTENLPDYGRRKADIVLRNILKGLRYDGKPFADKLKLNSYYIVYVPEEINTLKPTLHFSLGAFRKLNSGKLIREEDGIIFYKALQKIKEISLKEANTINSETVHFIEELEQYLCKKINEKFFKEISGKKIAEKLVNGTYMQVRESEDGKAAIYLVNDWYNSVEKSKITWYDIGAEYKIYIRLNE